MKTRTAVAVAIMSVVFGTGLFASPRKAMTCSLTNKTVKKCCCTKKEGKLYCTLAKKTIESCCCTPAVTKATSN